MLGELEDLELSDVNLLRIINKTNLRKSCPDSLVVRVWRNYDSKILSGKVLGIRGMRRLKE